MKLITWNVQWCRGVDHVVDPGRVVAEARRLADFDVLCLQEIADHFPAPLLPDNGDADQFATLAALLPGYAAVPGVAVNHPAPDGRRRFGNLILSRLPVRQVFAHLLPHPADPGVPGMPRVAVEAVIAAPFGDVRVITTHLEYYSRKQRSAQVEALRSLYAEGHGHARNTRIAREGVGPFAAYPMPASAIITGDFNLEPDDPLHERMGAPFADATPPLFDAWEVAHPGEPHPPTFCVYDKTPPGSPELHCDFIFVSADLRARIREVRVDTRTQVSDHQPVILTLA